MVTRDIIIASCLSHDEDHIHIYKKTNCTQIFCVGCPCTLTPGGQLCYFFTGEYKIEGNWSFSGLKMNGTVSIKNGY